MSGVFTKKGFDDACEASEGSLPWKLQQIAEEELGETPTKRWEALDKLGKLLDAEPDLNANRDAEFLLRFLRVRKYNVESALQTIRNYYRNRAATESLYRELLPCKMPPAARKIVMILPHRDVHGRPVLLVKPGSWMPDEVSYSDVHRAGLLCLEHLARDPASQVLGIVLLLDYGGYTVDKLLYTSISLLRRGLEYLQDCMPMRLKVAHHVRQSYAFDVFFALARPFIKAKLAERLRLHGQNFESLHEEISPKQLPEEYGGQGPPIDPEECWKAVVAEEDYFAACSRFGYAANDQDDDVPAEPEPPLELTSL
ncbi:alpha-tocopherol transfer protein-like [Dermacentor andersoni]|uniref:alpha-tocopherol transfer protein-like n=1 Tax=Dermacentor andersoni TaxID=34620 RepID=UPI002416205B|nr:alpha-tocopherol transfer protein-like [Dermacentor andersoni]